MQAKRKPLICKAERRSGVRANPGVGNESYP